MNTNNIAKCKNNGSHGPDSFWMHDPEKIFSQLKLEKGDVMADLGCGAGKYSLTAADFVGNSGCIYAVDKIEACLYNLKKEAELKGLKQIRVIKADLTDSLPIGREVCDLCFICTVLHAINISKYSGKIFNEVERVLKQNGRMFIIECKKNKSLFGPDNNRRISEDELDDIIGSFSFKKTGLTDLGYNYMAEYIKV